MISKQISVKYVIAKVLADNDMQEDTLRINDMLEYAAEAIERIGAFLELETKVAGKGGEPLLELANYQTALPTGIHSVIQAAYSESGEAPFYPMRTTSGSFDTVRGDTVVDTDDGLGNITYTTEDETVGETSFTCDYTYNIKPGYLVSNQQDGYVLLAYRTIPLDPDGYPYIPNDPGFLDAVYWYITMKLLYPKWVLGQIRDEVYYNARRSWNYYSKQAYGNSMTPSADMLESIKNTWNRLIPELGDHNGFYSTTGQEQIIYNQTNNGYATGYNNRNEWWF